MLTSLVLSLLAHKMRGFEQDNRRFFFPALTFYDFGALRSFSESEHQWLYWRGSPKVLMTVRSKMVVGWEGGLTQGELKTNSNSFTTLSERCLIKG